jgi:hypothetical protein
MSTPNMARRAIVDDNKESPLISIESRKVPSLKEIKHVLNTIGQPFDPHDSTPPSHQPPEFGRTSPLGLRRPLQPLPEASWAKNWSGKRVSFGHTLVIQKDKIPEKDEPAASLLLPETPTHQPQPRTTNCIKDAASYCKPFCDFISNNPTIFHTVDYLTQQLKIAGFEKLSQRDTWKLEKGGRYFVERNGSSMIAFIVGETYEPGNGVAMLAGHIDSLCAKLKPISNVSNKAGFVQLGVAPYAGAPNNTWWDRDLGIGGRVLVKESSGKIVTKLVKLPWPSMYTYPYDDIREKLIECSCTYPNSRPSLWPCSLWPFQSGNSNGPHSWSRQ